LGVNLGINESWVGGVGAGRGGRRKKASFVWMGATKKEQGSNGGETLALRGHNNLK